MDILNGHQVATDDAGVDPEFHSDLLAPFTELDVLRRQDLHFLVK